ncbi:hypothetical protein RRF57_010617 [Xylaria bambusicola]|uniref:Uncharacterized protein n=1 Tax=Xylaria bambusicola TaxID=326684 RepID=A0AAN7ULI9_9PEZI
MYGRVIPCYRKCSSFQILHRLGFDDVVVDAAQDNTCLRETSIYNVRDGRICDTSFSNAFSDICGYHSKAEVVLCRMIKRRAFIPTRLTFTIYSLNRKGSWIG